LLPELLSDDYLPLSVELYFRNLQEFFAVQFIQFTGSPVEKIESVLLDSIVFLSKK